MSYRFITFERFARLLIEKIRINTQYHVFGTDFTQAEFISTLFIFAGLMGILLNTRARYVPKIAFSLFIVGALSACAGL